MRSIELFTGAGGLALGIAKAGFAHVALVEHNHDACASLRQNIRYLDHGHCDVIEGDVRGVRFSEYANDIDLLAAGAPCQPFSIAGKHEAHQDDRNMFPEVFRAVREIAPRAVVVENVKGLLRASLSEYVEFIGLQLAMPEVLPNDPTDPHTWRDHLPMLRRHAKGREKDKGALRYLVTHRLLNAADYGVPQRRERVFFVAIREDFGAAWPGVPPTHSRDALLYEKWCSGSYWREHGAKPSTMPPPMQAQLNRFAISGPGGARRWQTVRDALRGLPEPRDYAEIPGWQAHIGQPGARSYPGHTGSPLDEPAKTLKAGVHGVPGGENMLRRADGTVRYFTVREAARLQTFPDHYVITGAWGEALRQLGNAVPARLAEAVANSVKSIVAPARATSQRKKVRVLK